MLGELEAINDARGRLRDRLSPSRPRAQRRESALKRHLEQRQEQETPERALATSLAAQKADITLLEAHARYR